MSITIEIPSALQRHANNQESISIESAQTVGEAFVQLCQRYPDLKANLYDQDQNIRSFINVYLNDDDIRYSSNLETPTKADDVIQIVPSIAGGC